MATMFDYIDWRGDLTFTQDSPNAVDSLIFSTLSYIRYGAALETAMHHAITLQEAAESFFGREKPEEYVRVEKDLDLLRKAALSTRFGQTKLVRYQDTLIPEQETQFAALTFYWMTAVLSWHSGVRIIPWLAGKKILTCPSSRPFLRNGLQRSMSGRLLQSIPCHYGSAVIPKAVMWRFLQQREVHQCCRNGFWKFTTMMVPGLQNI